jgi:predicted alpha/beta hydrolase family esterase
MPLQKKPQVLIVPGLYNSGPGHWQSEWERRNPGFQRVEQQNWDTPDRRIWLTTLDRDIRAESDNVILVGHSLGSIAIAFWAAEYGRKIAGALLVAPSDAEAQSFPPCTTGFTPIPRSVIPFPTTVIASTKDPYMDFARTEFFARAWGSELVSLGERGHISTADGFGPWPEGLQYLNRFYGE